jgi:hypothetical protein
MSCRARFRCLLEKELTILHEIQKTRQKRETKEEDMIKLELLKRVNHFPSGAHEYGGSLSFSQIIQSPSVQLCSDETIWKRSPFVVVPELPMLDRFVQTMKADSPLSHTVPLSCHYGSSPSAFKTK